MVNYWSIKREFEMRYADQQLSDLAIAIPMATEIFRKNRLDFCCGGKQTLKEACEKRDLNIEDIVSKLVELDKKETPLFEGKPLKEITSFIVKRYHDDLRQRIPELLVLSKKVEQVHVDDESCPKGLHALLSQMSDEIMTHLMKEENVLFPMINQGFGSGAGMPISVMKMDHEHHGGQLDEIRELTNDFTPPADACGTWRALYSGLEQFESELMEHIHLENNVLFPRTLIKAQ